MGSRAQHAELTALLERWRADRMVFRKEAVVLPDGRLFGEAMDSWQEHDFRGVDTHQHSARWRPRGHSKTFDLAVDLAPELILRKGITIYVAAADEDQGRLLFEDVLGIFQRNPVLAPLIRVTRREILVKATGSRLVLLNANAPTLYGLRPDVIAVDELAEHPKPDVWHALWTASGKRPGCRVHVISTPGWDMTSVARQVYEMAQREPDWFFSERRQCASWISPAWLAGQERTLPRHVFARLHEGRWVEGAGAFFTGEEVERIFVEALPDSDGPRALALDIGLSRDRSVLAVLRLDPDRGFVLIESLITWAPSRGGRVDLQDVEAEAVALALALRAPLILDPWQAVLMAQRLRAAGAAVVEYKFTPEGRRKLFGLLRDVIRDGRLRSRPHDELRRELLSLEVEERHSGWRVDHAPNRHDDHVVAVALALSALADVPAPAPELSRSEYAMLRRALPGLGLSPTFPGDDDYAPWREYVSDDDDERRGAVYRNQFGYPVR